MKVLNIPILTFRIHWQDLGVCLFDFINSSMLWVKCSILFFLFNTEFSQSLKRHWYHCINNNYDMNGMVLRCVCVAITEVGFLLSRSNEIEDRRKTACKKSPPLVYIGVRRVVSIPPILIHIFKCSCFSFVVRRIHFCVYVKSHQAYFLSKTNIIYRRIKIGKSTDWTSIFRVSEILPLFRCSI